MRFIRAVLLFADHSCEGHEHIFYVFSCLDRGGDVLQMVFVGPFGNFGIVYLSLQIAFVSYKDDDGVFGFDSAEVVPLFDGVFEGGLPGVIEDQDDSMASFEVGGDNGSVFLLSGGVPDVEFGEFVVEVNIFDFEVDGGDLGLFLGEEVALGESPEEGSLAYVTVPDKDELILFFLSVRKVPLFDHEEVKGLS